MTDLSVLYIGGTGTISASCVRRSVVAGMSVYVLNRGQNARQRSLPGDVTWLQADIGDAGSVRKDLGGLRQNPYVAHSREKIAAEDELMRACPRRGGRRARRRDLAVDADPRRRLCPGPGGPARQLPCRR